MRGKLTIHYLISFMVTCLLIFIINIGFMIMNLYVLNDNKLLFDYYPTELIEKVYDSVTLNEGKITISDEGISLLEENGAGLQVLNEENEEVFNYKSPEKAPRKYSNKSLIDMYDDGEKTLFLGENTLNGKEYSYLLFLNPNNIKRIAFSYDANEIYNTHNFPLLITINILVFLVVSFLYTLRVTKPISKIIKKIIDLSKGSYKSEEISKGIYSNVQIELNKLGERLYSNELYRQKLDKMREEWIFNISHDIKTPLTSIIGNAEIMADTEYDLDEEARVKSCNTIINKSVYIKTLVDELNLSTKLKSNSLILNKKQINIVSLVRHVVIDIINDEKYQASNINFTYSDGDIILNLDEQLIKRVFVNLILNSFIHNGSDVKVSIDIRRFNNRVNIVIADNGTGVSPDELSLIFKRYYRGTNTKNKTEGSGLGMAIAHDIIKAHDGEIKATSTLGEGLKIEVDFPL